MMQRDKDWPMIRRLMDSHYDEYRTQPTDDRVRFWLRESRTPDVLIAVAAEYHDLCREVMKIRPLLVELSEHAAPRFARSLLKKKLRRNRLMNIIGDP